MSLKFGMWSTEVGGNVHSKICLVSSRQHRATEVRKLHFLSSCQYTHGVARRLLGPHDTLPCVLICFGIIQGTCMQCIQDTCNIYICILYCLDKLRLKTFPSSINACLAIVALAQVLLEKKRKKERKKTTAEPCIKSR